MFSQFTTSVSNYLGSLQQSFRENEKKAAKDYADLCFDYLKNQNITEFLLGTYRFVYGNSLIQMLPQYRYIAKPVYCFFGGRNHPWIATAAAFCATDLIMHQLPTNMIICMMKGSIICENSLDINLAMSAYWVSLSIPIIIYKSHYLQKKDRLALQDDEEKKMESARQSAQFSENMYLMFARKSEPEMSVERKDENRMGQYRL